MFVGDVFMMNIVSSVIFLIAVAAIWFVPRTAPEDTNKQ